MAKLILTLENDSDAENPCNEDGWKLVSFNRRHASYGDPDKYLRWDSNGKSVVAADVGLWKKLEVGMAFILDYFEHGLCKWSLSGAGPQRQWDTSSYAGILLWQEPVENLGPKTYQDRRKDAASFLKTYTEWCNGNAYWFSLETQDGKDRDSCGGLYDEDGGLAERINESLGEGDEIIAVQGEAGWLAEYMKLKVKLPKPRKGKWVRVWE